MIEHCACGAVRWTGVDGRPAVGGNPLDKEGWHACDLCVPPWLLKEVHL